MSESFDRCVYLVCELAKERDELKAQVAALRGALEEINKVSTEQGLSMLDGACKVDKLACEALETTPSETAERVQKLVEALEEVEKMGTYKNADFTSEDSQEEPWAVIAGNALSEWRHDKCSSLAF